MSATHLSLQSGCHAFEEGILNQYDYVPSLAAGITFVALFGVTCALHVIQATWTRMWWGYVSLPYHHLDERHQKCQHHRHRSSQSAP
jgi:hypothetical protein